MTAPAAAAPPLVTMPCDACGGAGRQVLAPQQARLYHLLSDVPQTTQALAEAAGMEDQLAVHHLNRLQSAGLARRAGRAPGRAILWVRAVVDDGAAASPGARP